MEFQVNQQVTLATKTTRNWKQHNLNAVFVLSWVLQIFSQTIYLIHIIVIITVSFHSNANGGNKVEFHMQINLSAVNIMNININKYK